MSFAVLALRRSRLGRQMIAIRDNPAAAAVRALGVRRLLVAGEQEEDARRAARGRLEIVGCAYEELRIDEMGVNALYRDAVSSRISEAPPVEVRLRVAARTKDRANAEIIGNEVEALYTNGPAGGGGEFVGADRETVPA